MSDSLRSPAGVSTAENDPSRDAVQAAASRQKPQAPQADRARVSLPETVPEAGVLAPAPAREAIAPVPVPEPEAADRHQQQASKKPQKPAGAAGLLLDLEAVAHVEGLAEEVAMLRASIRELAHPRGDLSEHVKILAELRHQVEALCSTLKAQQALESREGGPAELNQTLDELGDRLGVSR